MTAVWRQRKGINRCDDQPGKWSAKNPAYIEGVLSAVEIEVKKSTWYQKWVKSSRVESNRIESNRIESSRPKSSRVESNRVEPTWVESSRTIQWKRYTFVYVYLWVVASARYLKCERV